MLFLILFCRSFLLGIGAFADGIAEAAHLFALGEVFAVNVGQKTGLLQVEFALFVQKLLIHIDTEDLSQEHIVAAQRGHALHLALQADWTFCDLGSLYVAAWKRGQVHFLEFIFVTAAADAYIVAGPHQTAWGQVDDKFPGFFDKAIGMACRADGNIGHWWLGVDDTGPCHAEDIGLLHRTAGHHGWRNRAQKGGTFPVNFCHEIRSFLIVIYSEDSIT